MNNFLLGRIVGTKYIVRFSRGGKIAAVKKRTEKEALAFAKTKNFAFIVREKIYTNGHQRIVREVFL